MHRLPARQRMPLLSQDQAHEFFFPVDWPCEAQIRHRFLVPTSFGIGMRHQYGARALALVEKAPAFRRGHL